VTEDNAQILATTPSWGLFRALQRAPSTAIVFSVIGPVGSRRNTLLVVSEGAGCEACSGQLARLCIRGLWYLVRTPWGRPPCQLKRLF